MYTRLANSKVLNLLASNPAVAILGPRQVGKTTLAKSIAKEWPHQSIYLDLERQSDLAKLRDPELYFKTQYGKLIIIDEIQRMPNLFETLRSIIDERIENGEAFGQFLLLGSSALELIQGVSESLAGRIAYIDLGSLNVIEIADPVQQDNLWLRGGFPRSFLAATDSASLQWREDFISSYLERDIPAMGPRVPAETLRKFWTMLAHMQGQVLNQSEIAASLGVSVTTVRRYLDLLIDLMLIRPLVPWAGNLKKRLIKSPKHYIRDSGLLHALLNIETIDDLLGHPIAGKSWEGFVIENILSITPKRAVPLFFEAVSSAEIDLVLEVNATERIAIEIKRSMNPSLSQGFYNACDDLQVTGKFVVYPGNEQFPYAKDIQIVSLDRIMQVLSK